MFRLGCWCALVGLLSVRLTADTAQDIARIHVESIGGLARLERFESLRSSGTTHMAGQILDIQMWAERPNRVRIESEVARDVLVQAWDGEHEPWIQVGRSGEARPLAPLAAAQFRAEADFYDPLYRPEERGFTLDYAGEDRIGDQTVLKLLVTRNLTEEFLLHLAADTYFILRRDEMRQVGGQRIQTQTSFGDFRPVLGVIFPHRITVRSAEGVLYETVLDWTEGNPPIDPNIFAMPGRPETRQAASSE